jgi:hypothetical protein
MDDYSYNKQIEVPWVLTHYFLVSYCFAFVFV